MAELLAAVEGWAVAEYLRHARWDYAAVNAAHILGIALLVGAVLPLDLRLLGLWRGVNRALLARVLVPVAAFGLVLAVLMGVLLFSVRAGEYAGLGVFRAKMALMALGALGAVLLHRKHGLMLETAPDSALRGHAVLSLCCWLGVLGCGRAIAFAAL